MKLFHLILAVVSINSYAEATVKLKCGASSDVTNFNSGIIPDSSGLTSTFSQLNTNCYGKMKQSLKLLQGAVKEGETCEKGISGLLGKLEPICKYLVPLHRYATKFQKTLKLLKKVHSNLDKITKFTDNIPKLGQLRKIIVEKVIPMMLDVLQMVNKEVRKFIDYERAFLKYEKKFKLIWNISKKGERICKLTSPLSTSLRLASDTIRAVNSHSKILLQTSNKAQTCMTAYCSARGSSCKECSVVDKGFEYSIPKITQWKTKMTQCSDTVKKVNQAIAKLNVAAHMFGVGEQLFDAIERFLKPIATKFDAFANSVGRVAGNMISCCPCGRPNTIGCAIEATTKVINLATCPLDGLTNWVIDNFLTNMKKLVAKFFQSVLPKINVEIKLPSVPFEIEVPRFLQQCFQSTSYGKRFTKLCALPGKTVVLKMGSSIATGKSTFLLSGGRSLSSQIKSSCSGALNALTKFGNNLKNCFDRIDDYFFAIPVIGIFAAMTCDPKYKDPDPGINYCPCKSQADALVNKDAKQPYCVVWHKSWMKSCSRTCQDKKYSPGKDPNGKTNLMSTTKGYPYCDKLKYYCRKANVKVKHGRISCTSEYTYLSGSCKVIADSGYVCPISHIICGAVSGGKSVCWDFRFIECSKNDEKRYPMCSCRNRDSGEFERGELVCQSGSTSSDSSAGIKEMRKSFSCFKPLGIHDDINKDCGSYMSPCIVQKPKIDAYERCSLSKAQKFWDAHGHKFVIAGAVLIALGVIAAIISGALGKIPAVIGFIILVVIGIICLACGLAFKRAESHPDNYVRLGVAN